jgi:siroheme synthase-like protein
MLDLRGKECLVVGGGRVAVRKVIGLLRAEASVTVVALSFNKHFRRLASHLTMVERLFSVHDITSAFALVIGATNSSEVNRAISERAAALNIPCNIVDCPELCSFIVPAVVRRGDITIALSTGGNSPRLSRHIKGRIAETLGPEYAQLASYMKEVRTRIRAIFTESHIRSTFWENLFDVDPAEYIHQHGWPEFRKRTEQLIDEFKQRAGRS